MRCTQAGRIARPGVSSLAGNMGRVNAARSATRFARTLVNDPEAWQAMVEREVLPLASASTMEKYAEKSRNAKRGRYPDIAAVGDKDDHKRCVQAVLGEYMPDVAKDLDGKGSLVDEKWLKRRVLSRLLGIDIPEDSLVHTYITRVGNQPNKPTPYCQKLLAARGICLLRKDKKALASQTKGTESWGQANPTEPADTAPVNCGIKRKKPMDFDQVRLIAIAVMPLQAMLEFLLRFFLDVLLLCHLQVCKTCGAHECVDPHCDMDQTMSWALLKREEAVKEEKCPLIKPDSIEEVPMGPMLQHWGMTTENSPMAALKAEMKHELKAEHNSEDLWYLPKLEPSDSAEALPWSLLCTDLSMDVPTSLFDGMSCMDLLGGHPDWPNIDSVWVDIDVFEFHDAPR